MSKNLSIINYLLPLQSVMKKVLITGVSGFIGSFIAQEALKRGFEVWAAVRKTTNRKHIADERIHIIELDLSSKEQMKSAFQGKSWDYVVHAAGVTKCLHREEFFQINADGTDNFARALIESDAVPERFVFISSLSAFGAVREQLPYTEILETDTPQPNTVYGESKMRAEQMLDALNDKMEIVTLRPTGVYGPREKDYFLMAKSIKGHVDFAVGYKPQEITFVYVNDLVNAIFLALERGKGGRKYFISDGNVYHSTDFSDLIRHELGDIRMLRIKAPVWFLRVVCTFGEIWAQMTGKMTALNKDKFNILRQRNWRCDITPAVNELGYKPEYDLPRGVKLTMEWYKKEGWI